jgi:hypothetical protein
VNFIGLYPFKRQALEPSQACGPQVDRCTFAGAGLIAGKGALLFWKKTWTLRHCWCFLRHTLVKLAGA